MTDLPISSPDSAVNRQAERRWLINAAQECFRAADVFDCPSLAEEGVEYLASARALDGTPLSRTEREMLSELWDLAPAETMAIDAEAAASTAAPPPTAEEPQTKPSRRHRKPTLAAALRQARRAGVPVRSVRLEPDGSIAIDIGEPEPTEASNPWRADLKMGRRPQ